MSNFFSDALRQAMASRHYNQAQLAEHLGVDPAYVSRWLKGSSPRIDQMRNVLITLGWDLERARPDYDAFEEAIAQLRQKPAAGGGKAKDKAADYQNLESIRKLLESAAETHRRRSQPPVTVIGRVDTAKDRVLLEQAKNAPSYEGLSPLFPAPGFADNELSMLVVSGAGLEPVFSDGARLLVRRVLRVNLVPDGTTVVLEAIRKPNELALRHLVKVEDTATGRQDGYIGAPVAPSQQHLFFKPREMRIPYAVVGVLAQLA